MLIACDVPQHVVRIGGRVGDVDSEGSEPENTDAILHVGVAPHAFDHMTVPQ